MTGVGKYITQGARITSRSLFNAIKKPTYQGSPTEICAQVTKNCWNGKYFQTSTKRGNFPEFWARDFGWCAQSLVKLGYQEEAKKTLRYAINQYKQHNKITTTIDPRGSAFDFPVPAVDSLPWLIHAMAIAKFNYYDHKVFLNKEITKFYQEFIDKSTGLVKANLHVSSMKDFTMRKSSCYDNTMVALLAKHLETLKLINPFKKYNYPDLLKRHFWNGSYFYDDLKKREYVAGDANIFPFLLGICKDKEMLKSVIEQIRKEELDKPLALKYTKSREDINFIWQETFMLNYESNACWMHMGPLYIKLASQIDATYAKELKEALTKTIEKHKNFYEVFTSEGKLFASPVYRSSPGMLWAANYLTL